MYIERLEDLSVNYFIKSLFTDVSGLPITDDYPTDNLVIPSISVNAGPLRLEDYELGNSKGLRIRKWYIDIYALNKAQRDEFGYRILNSFDRGIPIYDYNVGFPPASGIPQIEHLDVYQRELTPVRIMPELVDKLYYRSTITIVANNDTV